jgi:transcriptional regulator with XRE-family HTH domain
VPAAWCPAGPGLTLKALARAAHFDPGHLSRLERGEATLTVDHLYRLASVLEIKELTRLLRPYVRGAK